MCLFHLIQYVVWLCFLHPLSIHWFCLLTYLLLITYLVTYLVTAYVYICAFCLVFWHLFFIFFVLNVHLCTKPGSQTREQDAGTCL